MSGDREPRVLRRRNAPARLPAGAVGRAHAHRGREVRPLGRRRATDSPVDEGRRVREHFEPMLQAADEFLAKGLHFPLPLLHGRGEMKC